MSSSDLGVYLIGRQPACLEEPYQATDLVFGSSRLDGSQMTKPDFEHCTFANISFKEATIQSGRFLDCIFVGCYFRRTELADSQFIGCRFIDCQFPHVAIKSSSFSHSVFRGCQIEIEELKHCLPPEPNIREELCRNLSIESSKLGLSGQARLYRMAVIQAREQNLKAAILGHSRWYRDHYDVMARVRALIHLALSLLNRVLWGYGERITTLFRNLALAAFLLFPAGFYLAREGLEKDNGLDMGLLDLLHFSIENLLPSVVESGVTATTLFPKFLAAAESAFGIVVFALFAAYIFRWSLHR